MPSVIVITGASSGLGAALAREYAAPGVILGLLGRNSDRLEEVAADCRIKGAHTHSGG
jgi:NADP-dependent 3-hydroxy acid dehydrogenase YdfG